MIEWGSFLYGSLYFFKTFHCQFSINSHLLKKYRNTKEIEVLTNKHKSAFESRVKEKS